MDDAARLTGVIEGLRATHRTRSCREGWSATLDAARRWGDDAVVRRLVRAARRDLIRDRAAGWCHEAAAVLDRLETGRRWSVIDFRSVGIRSADVAGLWCRGLPTALRHEGVAVPDAAVLVNVGPLVRLLLPGVCREQPADLGMADVAGGVLVLAVALHEAAHAVVEARPATDTPTVSLPSLRAVVPGMGDEPRRDHHGADWATAVSVLTARACRVLRTPPPHDWEGWLWEWLASDLNRNCGIPGWSMLDLIGDHTRRPWHVDAAGPPPAVLVELFQRRDDAAQPGEAAA